AAAEEVAELQAEVVVLDPPGREAEGDVELDPVEGGPRQAIHVAGAEADDRPEARVAEDVDHRQEAVATEDRAAAAGRRVDHGLVLRAIGGRARPLRSPPRRPRPLLRLGSGLFGLPGPLGRPGLLGPAAPLGPAGLLGP